ncbi:MAG: vanadium-dependent haloperoxidase, partial [Planctomycetota bacterium]
IGNDQPGQPGIDHGYIQFGAQRIDQRVPAAVNKDYLITCSSWLDAQNGVDLRNNCELFGLNPKRRFITTSRDLATYVHDDALYQAYLNACLILLSMGTPFDPSFAQLSGQRRSYLDGLNDPTGVLKGLEGQERDAGGFALWGGPHILTLVTEVATRALKAVRYQKFNNHIRLRPEALAGRVEKADQIAEHFPCAKEFQELEKDLHSTVKEIRASNKAAGATNDDGEGTAFLPMAFQEGSPMHPSYGAGHATVAGACVTILKAFFDTDTLFVCREEKEVPCGETEKRTVLKRLFAQPKKGDTPIAYVPDSTGEKLEQVKNAPCLTLEGELNKLAANISIGRNMGGVHYYSDYYDSLRMGEEIAIGMLEEQSLCYQTDPFVLTVPTFDGDVVRIGAR